MKNFILVACIFCLTINCLAQEKKQGFLLAEQWPSGIGYTGGLYFPSGLSFQAQYIGLEKNWLLCGYSVSIKNWDIDLNAGAVVGKADAQISNLSLQCNAVYGDRNSKFNIVSANEYDPGLKNNIDFVWGYHQYLFKVGGNLFMGVCSEFNIESGDTTFVTFIPGVMIRYWLTDNVFLSLSPRWKAEGKTFNIKNLYRDNIYMNLFYKFKF